MSWRSEFLKSPIFQAAVEASKRTAVGNLWGASAGLFVAAMADRVRATTVLVTATTEEARLFAEDVKFFAQNPDDVVYFPSLEETYAGTSQKTTAFGRRLEVLRLIAERKSVIVCAGVTSLTTELPSPSMLAECVIELAEGMEIDRDDLAARFGAAGYLREAMVELPGHFSVRGAIVDVFDPAAASPLRIEFDGDRIESLRSFDPESQLSAARHDKIAVSLLVRKKGDESAVLSSTIVDHLAKKTVFHFRDPDDVERTFARKVEEANLIGAPLPMPSIAPLREFFGTDLHRMPAGESGVGDFAIGAVEARGSDFAGALATLEQLTSAEKSTVTIVFANEPERARFWESEKERPNPAVSAARANRRILDVVGLLSRGFRMRDCGRSVTSHRELFSIVVASRPATQRAAVKSRAIDDFVDLAPGDFVVHVAHGIAKFVGLEPMEKGGEVQDFLTLEFADGVRVYVPAAKTDLIQKYIGGRGEAPKLSKLGGRSWASKKAEVFRAVADLAAELLETQAVREREEGFAFPTDTAWQHEFEAAFPFEETPDQLAAIEAIRADMERKRPMDRLLCGDVGFGKTEVAMRAAFKAVQASKQVAVLVPTTVLAEQHTSTFRQRMADFPVRIDGMSRFKSKAEQTKTLIDLAEGKVDIVIGTHRLLSQDVVFKDLGLLVIDEEQRFGVQAKHRLRSLRRYVDVLTLSATPIPRTLHMSILGIRDISSLTQAPAARQPVETKIVNYDRNLIRAAILHELERGGQIFFVHNRVQSIERIAKELRAIAPEARVEIVHGQMAEGEIESAMHAFVRKEADILLATTIIESGLDIPNANTIFIDRPEMYGLADLHQLRGRVGRYREKAYAYLLLRPDSLPTEESEKRLRAIEEFTELGSGFRIAMRDLEIRGAGNILGHEQHGHISAVGYEMYCRLLDAAVKKLKNEDVVLPDEVTINLNFEASLPKSYIPDMRAKLEMYRKFGRATKDAEFDALTEEVRDRFGPPPDAALDFVRVCRIRAILERMRIRSIAISPGMGLLLRPANMKSTRLRLERTHCRFRVIGGKDVLIVHPMPVEGPQRVLDVLRAALRPDRTKVESLT